MRKGYIFVGNIQVNFSSKIQINRTAKQFFKPSWEKVIVTIFLIFLGYWSLSCSYLPPGKLCYYLPPLPLIVTLPLSIVLIIIPLFMLVFLPPSLQHPLLWYPIHLAYSYLLSCLILLICGRVKKYIPRFYILILRKIALALMVVVISIFLLNLFLDF